MRSFIICRPYKTLFGCSNQEGDGRDIWHVWGRTFEYRGLMGKREGKRSDGRSSLTWEDNIKTDLQEIKWAVWTRLISLRTGTSGGLL